MALLLGRHGLMDSAVPQCSVDTQGLEYARSSLCTSSYVVLDREDTTRAAYRVEGVPVMSEASGWEAM
jgi:hypothetical protein